MNHFGMDHGGHGGHSMPMPGGHSEHGGMDMGDDKCSMNMLFTWSTKNLCIVFKGWRVTGTWSLIFSLLAIVALGAGYEAVRELARRYEARSLGSRDASAAPSSEAPVPTESHSLLLLGRGSSSAAEDRQGRLVRAAFYAVQVFYSFFIMLLFMTYNGWIMLAVAAGAFVGYLLFGGSTAVKSVACH